jgi:type IV secretory pathway VirB3-like protein
MIYDYTVAPIYRSILYPPLMLGMPRNLFFLIMISTATIVVSFRQYWFLLFAVVALLFARRFAKTDIYIFEITVELMKLPERLD